MNNEGASTTDMSLACEVLKAELDQVWQEVQIEVSRLITSSLTRSVVAWMTAQGWHVQMERPILVPGYTSRSGRRRDSGRLDVWGESDTSDLAIEIDRGNKEWSLAKLVAVHDMGAHAIWVRWGSTRAIEMPDGVDLIELLRD